MLPGPSKHHKPLCYLLHIRLVFDLIFQALYCQSANLFQDKHIFIRHCNILVKHHPSTLVLLMNSTELNDEAAVLIVYGWLPTDKLQKNNSEAEDVALLSQEPSLAEHRVYLSM